MPAGQTYHRGVKRATGAFVLAAAVAAAVFVSVAGGRRPITNERLAASVRALPGVADVIGYRFDGNDYSGQAGARVVTVDIVVSPLSPRETLLKSMKAAGSLSLRSIDVYQRVIVTGYRSRAEFDADLPFAARAVWLSPELARPLDGWMTIRLPDEARAPDSALSGIYSRPKVVSSADGRLEAVIELSAEKLARPASDLREILAQPLIDCFDHDNAFSRSPDLKSIDITVMDAGRKLARFSMTRDAFQRANIAALRAALAGRALIISSKEAVYAEKYDEKGLFTPLLFDHILSEEDRRALKALEDERLAAESEFYKALFSGGTAEFFGGDAPVRTDGGKG